MFVDRNLKTYRSGYGISVLGGGITSSADHTTTPSPTHLILPAPRSVHGNASFYFAPVDASPLPRREAYSALNCKIHSSLFHYEGISNGSQRMRDGLSLTPHHANRIIETRDGMWRYADFRAAGVPALKRMISAAWPCSAPMSSSRSEHHSTVF